MNNQNEIKLFIPNYLFFQFEFIFFNLILVKNKIDYHKLIKKIYIFIKQRNFVCTKIEISGNIFQKNVSKKFIKLVYPEILKGSS